MVTLSLPGIALGEPGNSELPPPPTANIVNQDQHFRLALVINRFDTGKLIPVIQRNGHFTSNRRSSLVLVCLRISFPRQKQI